MIDRHIRIFFAIFAVAASSVAAKHEQATAGAKVESEKAKPIKMVETKLARERLHLKVPAAWKVPARPRSRIVEREYQIPPAKGDETPGRLTMMPSGGSLKQNVDRWCDQFTQPDGKATKDVAKVTEKRINGQKVTVVEISGTFRESMGGGPFAPGKTVIRKDYRMLGGIVQTKGAGQYFFKLYGPKNTIAAAEKGFMAMLESVSSAVPAK